MSSENSSSKNLKIPQLKMPKLKVKSHHHISSSHHDIIPLIQEQKEIFNNSYALSTNEEINNSINETFHVSKSKNYIYSYFNNNGNNTNRSHKGSHSPILKRRKGNEQNDNNFTIKRINTKSNFNKKSRFDFFGNEINHKNKRNVKITFRDQINENNDLCDIIDVECYKEYIKVYGKVNRKDTYVREKVECNCSCILF